MSRRREPRRKEDRRKDGRRREPRTHQSAWATVVKPTPEVLVEEPTPFEEDITL